MNKIKFYGLDDNQEKIAKYIYENNVRWGGNYTLEEVDDETAKIWIDDTDDDEYREFLEDALEKGAEVYSLTDHLGEFSQPIGEIAVYGYSRFFI